MVDKKNLFLGPDHLAKPKITPRIVTILIELPKAEETYAISKLETSTKKMNFPLEIAPIQRILIGKSTESGDLLDKTV